MLSNEYINQMIDKSITHLEEKREIFNRMENEPELLLMNLFNKDLHQPFYDLHMKVLGERYFGNNKSYHDIQKYLFNIIVKYFKSIDTDIDIVMKSGGFPSSFRIVYLDEEIVSFDIYKKYFGDFRRNKFENGIEHSLSPTLSSIKDWENKVELWQSYLSKPNLMFRSDWFHKMIDFVTYLKNKDNIKNNIIKRIEHYEKLIKQDKEQIERIKKEYEQYLERKDTIEDKLNEWRQRFIDWGYDEKERRSSSLY